MSNHKIGPGSNKTAKRMLTDEQRAAKNARDRERRAERKRAMLAETSNTQTIGAFDPAKLDNAIDEAKAHAEPAVAPPAAVAPVVRRRNPFAHLTPDAKAQAERQRYRDARVGVLARPAEGETWTERKARHRKLDSVLREGGPLPQPMRKKPSSAMTGNGLVMRRPAAEQVAQ